jgi:hypothetical protein
VDPRPLLEPPPFEPPLPEPPPLVAPLDDVVPEPLLLLAPLPPVCPPLELEETPESSPCAFVNVAPPHWGVTIPTPKRPRISARDRDRGMTPLRMGDTAVSVEGNRHDSRTR